MPVRKYYTVHIHLCKEDYEEFIRAYESTLYRSQSAYARIMLLGKPVKVITRDRSMDDFIEWAVKVRRDFKPLLTKDAFTTAEKEELKLMLTVIEKNLIQIANRCNR